MDTVRNPAGGRRAAISQGPDRRRFRGVAAYSTSDRMQRSLKSIGLGCSGRLRHSSFEMCSNETDKQLGHTRHCG